MLNKTIYATIFPHLKNSPGPFGNTSPANRGNGSDEVLDRQGRRGPSPASPVPQDVPVQQPQQQVAPAQPTAVQGAAQGAQSWMQTGQAPQQVAPAQPQPVAAPLPPAQPTPPVTGEIAGDPDYQQFQQTGMMPAGYVQPAPGSTAPASTPAATGSKKKKGGGWGPEIDPNLSPEDQAKKGLAYWQDMYDNPVNQDKGWKGLMKEIIENFLWGMSHTTAGMGWKEGLALGGIGAGGGFFNKTANEQRRAARELPAARERMQFETQQSQRRAQIANDQNQILNRNAQTRIEADEAVRKVLTAEQANLMKVWEGKDEVDPENNPEDKRLIDAAAKAGLLLTSKRRGERFTATVAPNGNVVVVNTSTGDYTVGKENLAKPQEFDEKLLSDDLFGLYDDKTIENMATAGVAQNTPGITYRPDVVAALPAEVKNVDGSFNLEAFSRLKAERNSPVEGITLDQIMANAPDNYKQRHAKEVEKLRSSQKETRAEVAKLRAALGNHRPGPNAKGKPLTKVVDLYKSILALPAGKDRKAKLTDFFEKYLPNVRIE